MIFWGERSKKRKKKIVLISGMLVTKGFIALSCYIVLL